MTTISTSSAVFMDICKVRNAMIAVLLSSACSLPALAQSAPNVPIPRVRTPIDENGVDLATGKVVASVPALTIGAGTGGLQFQRIWTETGWTHNYFMALASASGGKMQVVLGGQSVEFLPNGPGQWLPAAQNGDSLTLASGVWTYTARDGTTIRFSTDLGNMEYFGQWVAAADQIVEPNGRVLDLSYKVGVVVEGMGEEFTLHARLQSVVSSDGYHIKYSYADNGIGSQITDYNQWKSNTKVELFNGSDIYCDKYADNCTVPTSYPRQEFSGGLGFAQTTIVNNLGHVYNFTRGSNGLISVRRPSSPSAPNVTYVYDTAGSGRVVSALTDGVTTNYAWTPIAADLQVVVTDSAGVAKRTALSDATLSLIKEDTDGVGQKTVFTYDGFGRTTQILFPQGQRKQFTYDARGNVTLIRWQAAGNTLPAIATSATFPSSCVNAKTCNQPISTTDAKGNVTNYSYDSQSGGVATVTQPAVNGITPQVRYVYAPVHAWTRTAGSTFVQSSSPMLLPSSVATCRTTASCVGGADETRVLIAYQQGSAAIGSNALPVTMASGAGNNALVATTALNYDLIGNVLTIDGPLAGTADTVRRRFDELRRPVGEVAPDPDGGGPLVNRAVRLIYDFERPLRTEFGTVAGQSDAQWSSFAVSQSVLVQYNAQSRQVAQSVQVGGSTIALTNYSYDLRGRLDCTAVRMNAATFAAPPGACSLAAQGNFGPDRISRTIYDAADKATTVLRGFGTPLQITEVAVTYTPNGQQASLTDAKGNRTGYEYDAHGRLYRQFLPSPTTAGVSSSSDFLQYSYDANGNVTQRRLRDGSVITYTYDVLDRIVTKLVPERVGLDPQHTRDVYFSYDLQGRMLNARFDSHAGEGITNSYDALGRLTGSTKAMNGTWVLGSGYDLVGNRTGFTFADGLSVSTSYDLLNRPTSILRGSSTIEAYSYDSQGRRIWRDNANGMRTDYGYDSVGRLSSLSNNFNNNPAQGLSNNLYSFAHNPASQIATRTSTNNNFAWNGHYNVSRSYATNGLNQYNAAGPTSLTYDANGNLASECSTACTSYSFDRENRLVAASGAITAGLRYDPLGRLHEVTGQTGTTRFVYDGDKLVMEYNSAGSLQRRYVHGAGGGDNPVAWYEGATMTSANERFLRTDERGSVVVVSGASAIIGINSYDEFGIPGRDAQGNPNNLGRFQYTGQAWLPEIGMYYYKARIYSPTLGRFLQTDPIGYDDGMNMYAYVGNDPINGVDPSGLGKKNVATPQELPQKEGSEGAPIDVTGKRYTPPYVLEGLFAAFADVTGLGLTKDWVKELNEPLPQNEKKLSQCMINFIGSQGYNTNGLGNVTFYRGSLTAQSVYNTMGNPAITIGNSIHVASSAWGRISSPSGGATYFEEIVHTRQYESWGMVGFGAAYGVASAMGKYNTGDAHNNPVENQAIGMSNQLLRAYNNLPASKKCPD